MLNGPKATLGGGGGVYGYIRLTHVSKNLIMFHWAWR